MPGSIRKRGKSFTLRLYAGVSEGKKKWKWFTFASRVEAEAAQRELATHTLAHSAGMGLNGSPRERFGNYLLDWVLRQGSRLAPKTTAYYQSIAEAVKGDPLGTVPLAKLTPRALEAYYARLLPRMSSTTVRLRHQMFYHALRDGVRQDLIRQNVAELAEAPRRAKVRITPWSESEIALFLSESKHSSRYYPLYFFLVCTGCRLGEALGLEWRDVDMKRGTVLISQSLDRPGGGGYALRHPKTQRSVRTIALPNECIEELRVLGPSEGLVFHQRNGRPLHANNVRNRDLYPLCKRLGLPWRRAFHNLRHGHATHLLNRGVPLTVVQERLGHQTAAFTLDTYCHVLEGMQDKAVEAISDVLRGCTSPAPNANGVDPRKALENKDESERVRAPLELGQETSTGEASPDVLG